MNILLNGKTSAVFDKGTTTESTVTNSIQGLKKIYIDGVSGLTAEYQLTKKIAVVVSPTAKVALTSINSGASVKSHPNFFGVAGGIKINF